MRFARRHVRAGICPKPSGASATIRHNTILNDGPVDFSNFWTDSPADISLNYWGTSDTAQLDQRVWDILDDPNLGLVTYTPVLTQSDPQAPPTVGDIQVETAAVVLPGAGVGSEVMTVTVDFSAPMKTTTAPSLTFGVDAPYTQHSLNVGEWLSPTRWVGTYTVDESTGDGLNTFRVDAGRSADGFFAVPTDTRFTFTIATAGTQAMLLQAAAAYGHVNLAWPTSDMPDLAGYNVYRSSTPNGQNVSGPPLNGTLLTSPNFTDTAVSNGVTYYYKYTVLDTSFNESGLSNEAAATPTDPSPPSQPVVTDDGSCTASTTTLRGYWSAADPESGIAEFQYGLGTSPGLVNVVNWTSAGAQTHATKTGLNLSNGGIYYFAVKAKNGVGSWSTIGHSDGIADDAHCLNVLFIPLVRR